MLKISLIGIRAKGAKCACPTICATSNAWRGLAGYFMQKIAAQRRIGVLTRPGFQVEQLQKFSFMTPRQVEHSRLEYSRRSRDFEIRTIGAYFSAALSQTFKQG
jgi:hypothetical protein